MLYVPCACSCLFASACTWDRTLNVAVECTYHQVATGRGGSCIKLGSQYDARSTFRSVSVFILLCFVSLHPMVHNLTSRVSPSTGELHTCDTHKYKTATSGKLREKEAILLVFLWRRQSVTNCEDGRVEKLIPARTIFSSAFLDQSFQRHSTFLVASTSVSSIYCFKGRDWCRDAAR